MVSGCCVSANEMAATWAMNSLGTPVLWLSLMSSAATLPFFLFTSPAGALADRADRRQLLRISSAWLAISAGPGLLACCAFPGGLTPAIILARVFLLGTGFAFPGAGGCHMDATKSACFNSASTAPGLTGVPSSQSAPSGGPMSSKMPPHLETQVCLLFSSSSPLKV
jgi:MFS family permease